VLHPPRCGSNGECCAAFIPIIEIRGFTPFLVNLKDKVNSVPDLFSYLCVGQLNDHTLTVLQAKNRVLDYHIHEKSDEMFFCIEGEFDIEFVDGIMHLCEGDFIIIPKGTSHRPICKELVKCLLIEINGTLTRENTGGTYRDAEGFHRRNEICE